MRTGIGPVIKNHVTFQVHWIVSAVCHRVCCLTSSVPPGKQDQDQPTFLVRAKYWIELNWSIELKYSISILPDAHSKTSELVGALPREWLWLPVAWGKRDSEKETRDMAAGAQEVAPMQREGQLSLQRWWCSWRGATVNSGTEMKQVLSLFPWDSSWEFNFSDLCPKR